MPPARNERAVLFANIHSGRGRRWLSRVVEACREQDIELVGTHFDLEPRAIARALELACRQGVRAVMASGGDGTMGAITRQVVNTDFVLGVVPAGTSNDFARALHIPIDPAGAVHVVAQGIATRIDAGEANGVAFCHAAIAGINSEFASETNRLRPVLGRFAYPIAAVRAYRNRRRFRIRLQTSNSTESVDAYEIAILNAPIYGGPLELEVDVLDVTDHTLRVMMVEDVSVSALLRAIPAVLSRRHIRLPGVESLSITEARVDIEPQRSLTLDGEESGSSPVSVRVLPNALQVFVPPAFLQERA